MQPVVRYERLILTAGDQAVAVRFHPRLTVIAGVGALEREGIASELLGGLRGPRPGTNLEVVTDAGRRIGILRPGWGLGDRALDIDTGEELTERYQAPDGRLDLLAAEGVTLSDARRTTRLGALDLMAAEAQDGLVAALAGRPQGELWRAADRLIEARHRLEEVATAVGATPADTAAIAAVDARHVEFEAAQDRCERVRHHGMFTGAACALAGIPAMVMNRWTALPFALIAAVFVVLEVVFRRRLESARLAEEEALAAAGAASYGGFLHQRVAAMIGAQETSRREISAAVAEHRSAQAAWTTLVGDVDVAWALARKGAIAAAAASSGDREAAAIAHALARLRQADPGQLAQLITARMTLLQSMGLTGESLPLILDEPFEGLDLRVKRWLLELLMRAAGRPQLVLLTADSDVVEWARAEEPGGNLAVREPAPTRAERPVAVPG